MKAFGKISIYLGLVLLSFANLAFGDGAVAGHAMMQTPSAGHWSATFSSHTDPLYCHTEQKTGPTTQHGSGNSLPGKHPVPTWLSRAAQLNAPDMAGTHYFQASRHLLTALEVSDVIFPFHQFW